MYESEFDEYFSRVYSLKTQDLNFLKRDLTQAGAIHTFVSGNVYIGLTGLGWELARAEAMKLKDKVGSLLNALAGSPALTQRPALSGPVGNALRDLVGERDPSDKK
jgi:hypothetical protein